nr:hypothetical protein [Streptomyces triticisoli]
MALVGAHELQVVGDHPRRVSGLPGQGLDAVAHPAGGEVGGAVQPRRQRGQLGQDADHAGPVAVLDGGPAVHEVVQCAAGAGGRHPVEDLGPARLHGVHERAATGGGVGRGGRALAHGGRAQGGRPR